MQRILITGGNGFIGKNLSEYLHQKKNTVDAVVRNKTTLDNELRKCFDTIFDFNSLPDFGNYDTLIHCVGKAHDLKNVAAPEEYFIINTQLTKQIFDKFRNSNCKKFIFFSSVKAVADSLTEELTEDFIPNPQTVYGKSKLEAEQYITSQKLNSDQKYFILRPSMIHGKGNKGNLNLLYDFISKGIPYPLASYENNRSFLSVDNLNFIIEQLIESNLESNIFNVADDEPLSTNDLITLIADSLKKNPKLWHVNKNIIQLFAKIGDILQLPLNSERLKKLTENYEVSNKKLLSTLNIVLPLSSKKGLMKTFQHFHSK